MPDTETPTSTLEPKPALSESEEKAKPVLSESASEERDTTHADPPESPEPPDAPHDPTERITQLQQELREAREALASVERRQRIDAMLIEARAVDLEAARLLTEVAVQQMDQPDIASAVEDLKTRRPYLFSRTPTGHGAMGPRDRGEPTLDAAAQQAAESGDRRDLLRYLRLRRKR